MVFKTSSQRSVRNYIDKIRACWLMSFSIRGLWRFLCVPITEAKASKYLTFTLFFFNQQHKPRAALRDWRGCFYFSSHKIYTKKHNFSKSTLYKNASKLIYVVLCLFTCLIIFTDYLQVSMNEKPGNGSIGL